MIVTLYRFGSRDNNPNAEQVRVANGIPSVALQSPIGYLQTFAQTMIEKEDPNHLLVVIPVSCMSKLGYPPHAKEYQRVVLEEFKSSAGLRWLGMGNMTDSQGKVLDTRWDFRCSDIGEAQRGFEELFELRKK